jgi:hypothetical protein
MSNKIKFAMTYAVRDKFSDNEKVVWHLELPFTPLVLSDLN